ncbi:hypothetical protein HMPREF9074_09448 [Capnocytophaga sp. oral taxon 329 str. F0087]|nr:hypothetical protein HMPREF9074_09448 [Capnocytophaga sp. oral taxon 329 str. F0087]
MLIFHCATSLFLSAKIQNKYQLAIIKKNIFCFEGTSFPLCTYSAAPARGLPSKGEM